MDKEYVRDHSAYCNCALLTLYSSINLLSASCDMNRTCSMKSDFLTGRLNSAFTEDDTAGDGAKYVVQFGTTLCNLSSFPSIPVRSLNERCRRGVEPMPFMVGEDSTEFDVTPTNDKVPVGVVKTQSTVDVTEGLEKNAQMKTMVNKKHIKMKNIPKLESDQDNVKI